MIYGSFVLFLQGDIAMQGIVFFGRNLTEQEFIDDEKRIQTLRNGIEQIEKNCQDVKISLEFSIACAIAVDGSNQSIDNLKTFLDRTKIGTYQEDDPTKPIFRAARP